MRKISTLAFIGFAFLASHKSEATDPILKKNLEIYQLNYGNVDVNSKITNIDNSMIQMSAAGNALNISGNIKNAKIYMESYGNMSTNADISNVSGSLIQVNAIGNAVNIP